MAYADVLVHSKRAYPIRVIQATPLGQNFTNECAVFVQQLRCQIEAAFLKSVRDDGREQVLETCQLSLLRGVRLFGGSGLTVEHLPL